MSFLKSNWECSAVKFKFSLKVDKFCKHYSTWQKTDTQSHNFYGFICMKHPEEAAHRDKKQISGYQGFGGGEKWRVTT